jgi:hypothetical protein
MLLTHLLVDPSRQAVGTSRPLSRRELGLSKPFLRASAVVPTPRYKGVSRLFRSHNRARFSYCEQLPPVFVLNMSARVSPSSSCRYRYCIATFGRPSSLGHRILRFTVHLSKLRVITACSLIFDPHDLTPF